MNSHLTFLSCNSQMKKQTMGRFSLGTLCCRIMIKIIDNEKIIADVDIFKMLVL